MKKDSENINFEDYRSNIQKFMDKSKLTTHGWAKKAGISDSGLRAFLSGTNNSITLLNLHKLAVAAEASVAVITGDKTLVFKDSPKKPELKLDETTTIEAYEITAQVLEDHLGRKPEPSMTRSVVGKVIESMKQMNRSEVTASLVKYICEVEGVE